MVSTTARREAVGWLRQTRSTSLRRACRVVGLEYGHVAVSPA